MNEISDSWNSTGKFWSEECMEDVIHWNQNKWMVLYHFIQYLERNSDPMKEWDGRLGVW